MASPKWTEGLTVAGLYYDGVIDGDKFDEVIELHKRDTVSTFGTRSSRRVSEPKKKQIVYDENKPSNEQVIVKKVNKAYTPYIIIINNNMQRSGQSSTGNIRLVITLLRLMTLHSALVKRELLIVNMVTSTISPNPIPAKKCTCRDQEKRDVKPILTS